MKANFVILLAAILFLELAHASQEGVLAFSDYQITSDGIGESGPVTVNGKKGEDGKYKNISVEAFGKVIEIPKVVLSQIPSEHQNGILLSYERGYKEMGGKTYTYSFR